MALYFHWTALLYLLQSDSGSVTHGPGCGTSGGGYAVHKGPWQQVQKRAAIHPVLGQPSHHQRESLLLICTQSHRAKHNPPS